MPPKRANPVTSATSQDTPNKKTTTSATSTPSKEGPDDLIFEDPYEDEVEIEETDEKHAATGDEEMTDGNKKLTKNQKKRQKAKAAKAAQAASQAAQPAPMEDEEEEALADNEVIIKETGKVIEDEETAETKQEIKRVWRPGVDGFDEKTESLTYNSSAYTCLHRMRVEWPCLSFDIIKDQLGVFRTKFPHTIMLAAGTQAAETNKNKVMVLKISDIHKTLHDKDEDESDSESDDDDDPDDLDDDPILEEKSFAHPGGINRLRIMPQHTNILATWSDLRKVHVWDMSTEISALEQPPTTLSSQTKKPIHTFSGHADEGFALAWSSVTPGRLLSGDCSKSIYGWTAKPDGTFTVDTAPYKGHAQSVEDLQWSPTEANVFASCSADKTIRIWDSRVHDKCQLWVAAHRADVNVISWNTNGVAAHLLASGGDDGIIKVWDLRAFKSNSPAASFNWHKQPITSVEWHPTQESVVAASSEDNTLTVWDLGLEADEESGTGAQTVDPIPPQLYFVHQGQKNIKELHFHTQIPSMIISTAEDGFNFFLASNMS